MLEIENIPIINLTELPNKQALSKLEEFYKYYLSDK